MTLKQQMESDLATMLNTDEFAVEGIYSPKKYASQHPSSKSVKVNGIFDREFVEINGKESYSPVFNYASGGLCDVDKGAKLTVDGAVYTVQGNQPDGTGMTRLILEAP